ncbi:hypothetical protein JCM10295v2_001731 [Rhodotorula toruloides]
MSDPRALASLLALGISQQKAIYALKEHGGEVEAAADWCLGHPSRPRRQPAVLPLLPASVTTEAVHSTTARQAGHSSLTVY